MAKIANFTKNFNAMVFTIVACVLTLVSCGQNDVGDEALRSKTEYGIDFNEKSKLTPDNEYGTAVLHVELDKKIGSNVETRNADITAKCVANVETDPVETANMEKTFVSGEIIKGNVENSIAHTFTCDIKVNGTENLIKTKVTVTPGMAWDRSYDLNVTKIKVAADEVKIVETSKKAGEKARQAISAPVDFTICTVGTEKDNAEDHTCVVRQIVVWEQYQLESTPTIVDGDIDSWSLKIGNWNFDCNIHWKNIWSDGTETFEDYPYQAHYSGEAAALEDLFVKNWQKTLKNIEGLTVGTESKVKEEAPFTEYQREDIYAANHNTSSETTTKCVYFWRHPKVVFEKNGKKHVFDFVSPSFTENGNDLLDATSMKSGYDLKVFRNAVTVKYGNAETGIDEQPMEARQNLYKQARAVKSIEVADKIKNYKSYAIDYTVKYRLVYNDDEKSDIMEITTSRPWSLSYNGAWSMVATGDVNQSTTAVKVSSTGSNSEKQTIANGYWNCTTTNYSVANITTVDGKQQTNSWNASVPTEMVLNLYNTEVKFDKDELTAEAKNAQISLTNSTATQETYTFTEMLHATVGTDTETSQATGTVTKAVEVTVKSWSWENCWQKVEGNLTKAHVEKVYIMTDGSKKTISRDFTYTRNAQVITYWETTEANNNESTGAAQFSVVSNEAKSEGDWKFNLVKTELKFGVTCASTTQTDGWSILEANNLSVEIEGDVYTFDEMSYSASANASQAKTAESDNQTTYTHTNTPNYTFGGYSMSLSSATGKIFVAKTVVPESHDGYFPKSYGKIEGYNRVACKNPKNQKDWGIGVSVKFSNGSLCGFITKDGIIEWGSFESGSTVWQGASPDANGTLMNCNAKDASTAMKWTRESTINMLSYSDGTISGFHNGNNTVVTSMFPGSIEQKDGGKWQNLTMAGVRDAQGRTNFDSSF